MGQNSDTRASSLDGSYSSDASSASGDGIVIPSPNLPSSVSPELGTQSGQSAQPAIEFDDDGPGELLSSSGEEEDEPPRHSIYGQRERDALNASREARAAAVTARRRIRLRLDSDSDEDEEQPCSTPAFSRSKVLLLHRHHYLPLSPGRTPGKRNFSKCSEATD